MKYKNSIRFKALILLLVFSLNTVIGVACAIGVDMGFNTAHHQDEETTEVHVHADGNKHEHHNQSAKHPHEENKSKKEKSGCCNDDVQKFQSLDKAINQNAIAAIDVPVFAAIISVFSGIDIYNLSQAYAPKYRIRFFYPPPSDIRIAIQSFQI